MFFSHGRHTETTMLRKPAIYLLNQYDLWQILSRVKMGNHTFGGTWKNYPLYEQAL